MRLAFVTDDLPRPGAAGHLALNHAIIDWAQSQGHDVRVLLTGQRLPAPLVHYPAAPVSGPHIAAAGRLILPRDPATAAAALLRQIFKILPKPIVSKIKDRRNAGAHAVLGSFITAPDAAWCATYLSKWQPAAVLIDTIFRINLINHLKSTDLKTILIAHDVFHRRHMALTTAGYKVAPERLTATDEAILLKRPHYVAAIQPEEAALIRALRQDDDSTFLLPMPAIPCPRPAGATRLANRLVFTGSAALPNLDGMRWFLAAIWPQLSGHGISLDIVGDAGPALGALPNHVTAHGRVKNLAPLLHSAALAIAPLRAGSGLKIKLLDYARHGLTTIATPCSVEGFAATSRAPFIVAATPEHFAQAILSALQTPPAEEPALDYVRRYYGWESSFAGLRSVLEKIKASTSEQAKKERKTFFL